jgi:hypothetical protein
MFQKIFLAGEAAFAIPRAQSARLRVGPVYRARGGGR